MVRPQMAARGGDEMNDIAPTKAIEDAVGGLADLILENHKLRDALEDCVKALTIRYDANIRVEAIAKARKALLREHGG